MAVRTRGEATWYVRRSDAMGSYPGCWILPSFKVPPGLPLPGPKDGAAWMEELSHERLGGVTLVATASPLVVSGDDPRGHRVTLRHYEVVAISEPVLESRFYVEAAWMTQDELDAAIGDGPRGLCVRGWSRYQCGAIGSRA